MLDIKSLEIPEIDLLAIVDMGDESEYMHCSIDHISDIPSDFLQPDASLSIYEQELGDSIINESLYVDREVDTYRPYTAAEFKARSLAIELSNSEV